jgi:hypothetical protein
VLTVVYYIQLVQAQKLKLINQSLNDFDTFDRENLEVERWEVMKLRINMHAITNS